MRAVILADTHVPSRARALPPSLWAAIDAADVVLHAGDWVSASLVTEISDRARLVGCYGNNDGADVRALVPEVARVTLGGVRVAVVHETGQASARERRMEKAFGADTDLLVFGHSHIPWDSRAAGGLRLLNPGSPTDKRRQPVGTWIEATFSEGDVDVAWRSPDPVL
ncbi:MAG TPA: metallophosphoesterase family protein [Frankiaceae bacterium]|nr:metallophosphoesterase family protein [Frankiaceae bacterium]